MNCDRVRELLQEGLDGHPLPDEAARHLDGCGNCLRYSREMERIDAWLTEEPEAVWRPALTRSVMRRVRRDRVVSVWQVAAAAAVLLVCLWLGADALSRVPAMSEAGQTVTARVSVPTSAGEALGALKGSIGQATEGIAEVPQSMALAGASLWIMWGLLGVLAIDGLRYIGRRRKS